MSDFGENTKTVSIHSEVSDSSKCSMLDSTQKKKKREWQGRNASDGGSSCAITGEENGLCFQSIIPNEFFLTFQVIRMAGPLHQQPDQV